MCRFRRSAVLFACALLFGCGSKAGTPAGPSQTPGSASGSGSASSGGVRLTDDLSGRQLFPADNWWNQDITNAPVDAQSAAYINFIGRTRTGHPDFGPPPYGIPYVGVSGSEPRTPVTFVEYGSESDNGFRGEVGYPIPEAAKTQANYIEGGVAGGGSSGDRRGPRHPAGARPLR